MSNGHKIWLRSFRMIIPTASIPHPGPTTVRQPLRSTTEASIQPPDHFYVQIMQYLQFSIGTAAVTTGSVVARLSFAPDGAHASHSHRQYDHGGRRGAREARERALGVMLTWRGQARAPSATRISCRRTPRWYAPISTPTDVTRPVAGRGPSLGPPSINRWAPADQRTENIAAAEGYELGHWLPDDGCE